MAIYSAVGSRFAGTFLDKSRPYMSEDEKRAAEAVRTILTVNSAPAGMHAKEYAERVMDKALRRIQELGSHAAFADEIEAKYGDVTAKKEAAA